MTYLVLTLAHNLDIKYLFSQKTTNIRKNKWKRKRDLKLF